MSRKGNTMCAYIGQYKNPKCYDYIDITSLTNEKVQFYDDIKDENIQSTYKFETGPFESKEHTLQVTPPMQSITLSNEIVDYSDKCSTSPLETVLPTRSTTYSSKTSVELSYSQMSNMTQTLYNLCKNDKKKNVIVGGFLLQMIDVLQNKDSHSIDSTANVEKEFEELIMNYKATFQTKEDVNLSQDASDLTMFETKTNYNYAPSNRLISNMETAKKTGKSTSIRSNQKKSRHCTFCGNQEHSTNNCHIKESIGTEHNFNAIMKILTKDTPFMICSQTDGRRIIKKMDFKNVYHVNIHMLKSTVNPNGKRPSPTKMVVEITCYNQKGVPITGKKNVLVPLEQLMSFLRQNSTKATRRFFSTIYEESVGIDFLDIE